MDPAPTGRGRDGVSPQATDRLCIIIALVATVALAVAVLTDSLPVSVYLDVSVRLNTGRW